MRLLQVFVPLFKRAEGGLFEIGAGYGLLVAVGCGEKQAGKEAGDVGGQAGGEAHDAGGKPSLRSDVDFGFAVAGGVVDFAGGGVG